MKAGRKKVVMLAGGGTTYVSGGVGTFIRYLTDEWENKPDGPEIRILDTRGQGGLLRMIMHFISATCYLTFCGLAGRIDVLHIHMSAYGSAVRKSVLSVLGTMLGLPVIVHMHGSNFHKFYNGLPSVARTALRFSLNRAHCVVVLGKTWREFLIRDLGILPHKITVIDNGVPAPLGAVRRPHSAGAAVRIVFLGQLGDRKGVPELVAALRSPRIVAKAWTATIAGDGAVEETAAAVAKAGLQDRIAVPGWVDRERTQKLLCEADIFILPSHFEAMPIAILEAMAHGVPVIATPVGAIPEFLTAGQTALLVPPGDPEELAKAIERLLDHPEERERLGSAGNRLFRERFDIRVAADRILELYDSAVQPFHRPQSIGGTTAARRAAD